MQWYLRRKLGPPEYKEPLRLLRSRLLLLAVTALVIAGIPSVWRAYQEERQSAELERESALRLAELQQRKTQLTAHITDLTSDAGMEAAVRERYDVGKSGEHLVIIVNPQNTTSTSATTSVFADWIHRIFPW